MSTLKIPVTTTLTKHMIRRDLLIAGHHHLCGAVRLPLKRPGGSWALMDQLFHQLQRLRMRSGEQYVWLTQTVVVVHLLPREAESFPLVLLRLAASRPGGKAGQWHSSLGP